MFIGVMFFQRRIQGFRISPSSVFCHFSWKGKHIFYHSDSEMGTAGSLSQSYTPRIAKGSEVHMYIRKVRYRISMVKTRQDRSGDSCLAYNNKPLYVIVMIPVRDSSDIGRSFICPVMVRLSRACEYD